jgi:hypothetical protein
MNKPVMTTDQLRIRVIDGARGMMKDMKRQGQRLTLTECKFEMERVLKENYIIK